MKVHAASDRHKSDAPNITGVARNLDWGGGGKLKKFCDVNLVTQRNGDDVTEMTS